MLPVKDIVMLLKGIPSKYSQEEVLKQIANNLGGEVEAVFEEHQVTSSEFYPLSDICAVIESTGISKFQASALFYDLSEGDGELHAEVIINKLKEFAPDLPKKSVSFPDPVKDDAQVRKLQIDFVNRYEAISADKNVQGALQKFSAALKQFRTVGDCISRFDTSGKGVAFLDWFRKRLDDIKGLADDEKVVLTFIPVNRSKADLSEVSFS